MSVFLEIPRSSYVLEGEYFFVIKDKYPVAPGHLLIITKTIRTDYFSLTNSEKMELTSMIDQAISYLEKEFQPDGYNIGMNCGEVAGQTVFHFHCHIIPRYKGDMVDPTGGVRGVIPEKQKY